MLDPEASALALRSLFRRQSVVDLQTLKTTLETRSHMSVFRRMRAMDYLSSFTHSGRHYTLARIPRFDSFGLWFVDDIGFSRAGTLKATLLELIDQSSAGMFHHELKAIVRLSVHNTLRDLIQQRQLSREPVPHAGLLYLCAHPTRAQLQLATRLGAASKSPPDEPLSDLLVIEILLEVILASRLTARPSPETLAKRLLARGVVVTPGQTCQVFQRYELGKKRSRSP